MQKKLLSLLLAASASIAVADATATVGNGLYVGAGAGAGWNNSASPAATFRLDGGYNFTDNWAAELGYTNITQSGGGVNQSVGYTDLSLKGTLPLGQMLGIFAQVGGAYGNPGVVGNPYDSNAGNSMYYQAGWNFLTAAGIQANLTRQVSLNLTDYYYYGAPNPQGNSNVLLAGLKFNF